MKILFTDMDGTLLNNESRVSDYTRKVLKRMVEAGHKLVLSSGRPIDSMKWWWKMTDWIFRAYIFLPVMVLPFMTVTVRK